MTIICPFCLVRIIPTVDGVCPACREVIGEREQGTSVSTPTDATTTDATTSEQKICPMCGTQIPVELRSCSNCGEQQAGMQSETAGQWQTSKT